MSKSTNSDPCTECGGTGWASEANPGTGAGGPDEQIATECPRGCEPPPEEPDSTEPRWFTGHDTALMREGMAQYTVMIRAPEDPDPTSKRGSPEHRAVRERWGVAPHLALKKLPDDELRRALLEALEQHKPCTLNRVGVAAFSLTADILTTDRVLDIWWGMVERGEIEHTNRAPILWRRATT